jgi:hypothetical protein
VLGASLLAGPSLFSPILFVYLATHLAQISAFSIVLVERCDSECPHGQPCLHVFHHFHFTGIPPTHPCLVLCFISFCHLQLLR